VAVVALSAFEVRGAAGTAAGRVAVRWVVRLCASAGSGSAAVSIVKTIVLKNNVNTFLLRTDDG
jgi:hypothetical protein